MQNYVSIKIEIGVLSIFCFFSYLYVCLQGSVNNRIFQSRNKSKYTIIKNDTHHSLLQRYRYRNEQKAKLTGIIFDMKNLQN